MSIFYALPQIHAKDLSPQKPRQKRNIFGKKVRGNPTKKYDHWQMLQDRLEGMSWRDIGVKHHVPGETLSEVGVKAKNLATYSQASLSLTPAQVEALHEAGIRKKT